LAETLLQNKIWDSPLVSSLKSGEDLLTSVSAELTGNYTNAETRAQGQFASETWRVKLESLERQGPVWAAHLGLDLSEVFLNRYLVPGPLVKAKGRPIPKDLLPPAWGAGYHLSVRRGDGSTSDPAWKIE
jgi:hypothetical protein